MSNKSIKFLLLVIPILLAEITTVVLAEVKKMESPKYKLEYTEQEWGIKLLILDNAKEVMRKSSLPGNIISQWQDSLSVLQNDIQAQIGAQIKAQQKPVINKQDSTTTKKKQ